MATPHFYINPPFYVYPPFLAKNFTPPSDSIFGRSYSSFNKGEGGGFQLCSTLSFSQWYAKQKIDLTCLLLTFFLFFQNFDFSGFFGGRAKNSLKWQKILSVALHISEPYIIWLSFLVHICKMISSGIFFKFDFPSC